MTKPPEARHATEGDADGAASVRPFRREDAGALAGLMTEMARSYGASVDPRLSVAEEIVRQADVVDIIVAKVQGVPSGFATFASLFPVGGLIPFTYVQQIYVAERARRLGLARRLMAEIARIARERGSTRMEWFTGRDNAGARRLYESLGAVGSDKIAYVLDLNGMDDLARGDRLPLERP